MQDVLSSRHKTGEPDRDVEFGCQMTLNICRAMWASKMDRAKDIQAVQIAPRHAKNRTVVAMIATCMVDCSAITWLATQFITPLLMFFR